VARIRISAAADADIDEILEWTAARFGGAATERYWCLISSALRDLRRNPARIGSARRPEIVDDARTYHLRYSRRESGVDRPRHLILYRVDAAGNVDVGRVLHEAMDLVRHASFDFPDER
jgi:toxin ParE1/3/4